MQATVRDLNGDDAGSVDLPEVFSTPYRPAVLPAPFSIEPVSAPTSDAHSCASAINRLRNGSGTVISVM